MQKIKIDKIKSDIKSTDIKFLKKELRKRIQSLRNNLPLEQRVKKSKIIVEKLSKTEEYIGAKNILIYFPFRSEIDTTAIIKDALAKGKRVILPRVANGGLELYFVKDLSKQLEKGSFGIMEPIPSLCELATPEQVDLAIIPGVAFDANLNRLGYGGGFYDRLSEDLPSGTKKIALSFEIQMVQGIPTTDEDKKIDMIITERKIYKK